MADQVRSTWYATARATGVSELDCERIPSAFVYEGFSYDGEAYAEATFEGAPDASRPEKWVQALCKNLRTGS